MKTQRLARFCLVFCLITISILSTGGRFLQKTFPQLEFEIPIVGTAALLLITAMIISSKNLSLLSAIKHFFALKNIRFSLGTIALLALGILLSESIIMFEIERIHFVKYGLLTVLIYFSLTIEGPVKLSVITAISAAAVGIGEEVAQIWIPNRFFDWRDVWLNLLGVSFGVAYSNILSSWIARLAAAKPLAAEPRTTAL